MEREFPRGTDSARLVEVIETKSVRGGGSNTDSPCRVVTQYWSKAGVFLAENDPSTKESPPDGGAVGQAPETMRGGERGGRT